MTKQPRSGTTSTSAAFVGVPGRASRAMAIRNAAASWQLTPSATVVSYTAESERRSPVNTAPHEATWPQPALVGKHLHCPTRCDVDPLMLQLAAAFRMLPSPTWLKAGFKGE